MFGRADAQLPPGLNFKIPLIQTVRLVEVRQRQMLKNSPEPRLSNCPFELTCISQLDCQQSPPWICTSNMMESHSSKNEFWIPNTLCLQSSHRKVFSRRFDQEPQLAVNEIQTMMVEALADFPIVIDSPQIENIDLPPRYLEAVEAKMTAYEAAKRAHLS